MTGAFLKKFNFTSKIFQQKKFITFFIMLNDVKSFQKHQIQTLRVKSLYKTCLNNILHQKFE